VLVKPSKRICVGAVTGLALASLCTVYVALLALVKGNDPTDGYGVSFGGVVLGYFTGFPLVGALLGLLFPLARKPAVGIMFGGIAFAMVITVVALLSEPLNEWLGNLPWYLGFGAVGGAAGTGIVWRHLGIQNNTKSPGAMG
jgi:hypothetical protein